MNKIKNMTKKQKVIAGSLLGAILIVLVFVGISMKIPKFEDNKESITQENTPKLTLEYGEEVKSEYIISKNGEEIPVELPEEVDTMIVGEKKYTIDLGDDELIIVVSIEDTKHPIVSGSEELEVEIGTTEEEFKELLLENVEANDPIDGELEVTFNLDKLELEKVGSYEILVNAKDNNGNRAYEPGIKRTEAELKDLIKDGKITVEVIDKVVEVEEEEEKPAEVPASSSSSPTTGSNNSSSSGSSGSSSNSSGPSSSSGSGSSGSSGSSSSSSAPSGSGPASSSPTGSSGPGAGQGDLIETTEEEDNVGKSDEDPFGGPVTGDFDVPSSLPSGSSLTRVTSNSAVFNHSYSLSNGAHVSTVTVVDDKKISFMLVDEDGNHGLVRIHSGGFFENAIGGEGLSESSKNKMLELDSQYRSSFGW